MGFALDDQIDALAVLGAGLTRHTLEGQVLHCRWCEKSVQDQRAQTVLLGGIEEELEGNACDVLEVWLAGGFQERRRSGAGTADSAEVLQEPLEARRCIHDA